jgi:hypothetical protein
MDVDGSGGRCMMKFGWMEVVSEMTKDVCSEKKEMF